MKRKFDTISSGEFEHVKRLRSEEDAVCDSLLREPETSMEEFNTWKVIPEPIWLHHIIPHMTSIFKKKDLLNTRNSLRLVSKGMHQMILRSRILWAPLFSNANAIRYLEAALRFGWDLSQSALTVMFSYTEPRWMRIDQTEIKSLRDLISQCDIPDLRLMPGHLGTKDSPNPESFRLDFSPFIPTGGSLERLTITTCWGYHFCAFLKGIVLQDISDVPHHLTFNFRFPSRLEDILQAFDSGQLGTSGADLEGTARKPISIPPALSTMTFFLPNVNKRCGSGSRALRDVGWNISGMLMLFPTIKTVTFLDSSCDERLDDQSMYPDLLQGCLTYTPRQVPDEPRRNLFTLTPEEWCRIFIDWDPKKDTDVSTLLELRKKYKTPTESATA